MAFSSRLSGPKVLEFGNPTSGTVALIVPRGPTFAAGKSRLSHPKFSISQPQGACPGTVQVHVVHSALYRSGHCTGTCSGLIQRQTSSILTVLHVAKTFFSFCSPVCLLHRIQPLKQGAMKACGVHWRDLGSGLTQSREGGVSHGLRVGGQLASCGNDVGDARLVAAGAGCKPAHAVFRVLVLKVDH